MNETRRKMIRKLSIGTLGLGFTGTIPSILSGCGTNQQKATVDGGLEVGSAFELKMSLAQWSLHRSFFGDFIQKEGWAEFGRTLQSNPDAVLRGTLNPVNFPRIARTDYGLGAIELVNTFYFSKKDDSNYWTDFKSQSEQEEVSIQLIMCDREGNLGEKDAKKRSEAITNHHKWIDIAAFLGAHSIRVNAAGQGTAKEVKTAAVDGLGRLAEYGKQAGVNVIVENHGGYSSDGLWLSDVIRQVNMDNCGTLPDFGNFCIKNGSDGCEEMYDRYKGMKELLPFAKGVSAKSHSFDEHGKEVHTDFKKMMDLVKESGFRGYVGIEYEGNELSEKEGIIATMKLLLDSV